jgi:hypothetical protein
MREELVQPVHASARHFDTIRKEIERALRAELKLAQEDRSERARSRGIPWPLDANKLSASS